MAHVTLDIPDDLVQKLSSVGNETGQTLCLAAAFSLCSRGVVDEPGCPIGWRHLCRFS
jgi:hypothetical protein